MLLVLVHCPQHFPDRVACAREIHRLFAELEFVFHAVFPLRHDHRNACDFSFKSEVSSGEKLVQQFCKGVWREVRIQVSDLAVSSKQATTCW